MKKFALYVTLCSAPPLIVLYITWLLPLIVHPQSDNNLIRLFPQTNNGLIAGTSRSAQGIDPNKLSEHCTRLEGLFNFSFNVTDSPWSKQYRRAINWQSEHTQSQSPTFILSVDPWSLRNDTEEPSQFLNAASDSKLITTLRYALTTPPLTTISDKKEISKAIADRIRRFKWNEPDTLPGLTSAGWLANTRFRDSSFTQWAIVDRINLYRAQYPRTTKWPTELSMSSLTESIELLTKQFPEGQIILLRMPTTVEMQDLEQETFPEFNTIMVGLALNNDIPYIDANGFSESFRFNDAHHLYHSGASEFSQFLGDTICQYLTP